MKDATLAYDCGLGISYANLRQFEQSISALTVAQGISPGDPLATYHLNAIRTFMQQEKNAPVLKQ